MRFFTVVVGLSLASCGVTALPQVGAGTGAAIHQGLLGGATDEAPAADKPKQEEAVGSEDPLLDTGKWCRGKSFESVEDSFNYWDSIGVSYDIDSFIRMENGGPKNWLQNFEQLVFNNEIPRSGSPGCALLQGDCAPGNKTNCATHFKMAQTKGLSPYNKPAFWIFEAVEGLHAMLSEYYRNLQDGTLYTSTKIDEIVEKIGGHSETSDDMMSWLTAGLNMVGSGIGSIPGLGPQYGIIATIISNSAKKEKPINGKMSAALGDLYKATSEGLERALAAAIGSTDDENDYAKLPAFHDTTYDSPIANFFNTGAWLVDIDKPLIKLHMEEAKLNIIRKVTHETLVSKKWVLVINDKRKDAEDCTRGVVGRQWIEWEDGKSYCVMLRLRHSQGDVLFQEPEADFHKEVIEEYGLGNRDAYYRSIMDCAFSGRKDGSADLSNSEQGKVPQCYFAMSVWAVDDDWRANSRSWDKWDLREVYLREKTE